jgi:hypothetical protein
LPTNARPLLRRGVSFARIVKAQSMDDLLT